VNRALRVLHGPVNIGNQAWSLSRAERRLGLRSELVIEQGNWLAYPADRVLVREGEPRWAGLARRIAFGAGAALRYDVVHYYFGRSYIQRESAGVPHGAVASLAAMADLKLARRMGRKVFMTLQGCDARLAQASNARNEHTMCAEGRCSLYRRCLAETDERRRWLIDEILPLCDRVLHLNPELGHYVPGSTFLPYANVEIDRIRPAAPSAGRRPRIVHAPTNGSIKGTAEILAALDTLKARYDFEVVLVEGRPHEEAMAIYREADLVIDQIWAGWYGGLAVEVMAMAKPVGAYVREEDLDQLPADMRRELPVLQIRPDRLACDLAAILEQRDAWPATGAASRRYVERWHHPDRIARAMASAYRDASSRFDLAAA
jgi:hypothetical protein